MDLQLTGKSCLITGASRGIGLGTSKIMAAEGCRMALVARRKHLLEELADEIAAAGHHRPIVIAEDVTRQGAPEQIRKRVYDSFGGLDILVNNAGLALGLASSAEGDLEDWEQMIDTNIKGLLYCSRTVLPKMIEKNSGHIINIGSVAGSYPYPGGNVYGGTKAFVRQCSLNMRADLLGTNVRVSCIEPGMTDTEFLSVRFKGDTQKVNNFLEGANPMTAAEVAEVIYFVATAPSRLNINLLELMPVSQAFGPFAIHRE